MTWLVTGTVMLEDSGLWNASAYLYRWSDGTYHVGCQTDPGIFRFHRRLSAYKTYGRIYDPSLPIRRQLAAVIEHWFDTHRFQITGENNMAGKREKKSKKQEPVVEQPTEMVERATAATMAQEFETTPVQTEAPAVVEVTPEAPKAEPQPEPTYQFNLTATQLAMVILLANEGRGRNKRAGKLCGPAADILVSQAIATPGYEAAMKELYSQLRFHV